MAAEYELAAPGPVRIVVMDVQGRRLATLVDGFQTSGRHTVVWDGRDEGGATQASGVYFAGSVFPAPPGAGALAQHGVAHGEWWRLISAAFLHYGPFHLAINMYSLFFAGTLLEQVIGRWRFALLYLVSGLAGSAGALYCSQNAATVGASGTIFGVLGGLLVLERRGNIATGGQVAVLIVLNLVLTFALANISIGGHIGGLIAGVLLMIAFLQFRRSLPLSVGAAAGLAAISIVVAYSAV